MPQPRSRARALVVVVSLATLILEAGSAEGLARPPEAPAAPARHPLDPLSPEEITRAVAILREVRRLPATYRFVSVALNEPAKALVLRPPSDGVVPREAAMVLLDKATGTGYEAVVDLAKRSVPRFEALPPGTQPAIMLDEFAECEEAARNCPAFREALKRRGIEDMNLVMVDAWSAGHYGNEPPEDKGKRLVRSLSWVKANGLDNGYARPIEGVVTIIDLNRKEVVRVEDHGVVPLPPKDGNWTRSAVPKLRDDLKPLDVSQADGPSFTIEGQEVRWQKWAFRVGFNPREGLVLNTVGYDGRPILYRGSVAEMIVPYGDPKTSAYRKNVFDLGEYGIGMLANSLALGCDCLGTIRYFDGHLADNQGRVVTIKNAVCVHEEDIGLLWKHTDWRTNQSEVRRSRRLAVSMIANVGNYDYGFYWYFYQDGSIQLEVKLTGIVNTQALKPGEKPVYGTEVAPRLNAPNHQHFFNARLDLDVDGPANTRHRGQHPGHALRPRQPRRRRVRGRGDTLDQGVGRPAEHQPHFGPVLAGRQRVEEERDGRSGRVSALPGREHPAPCPAVGGHPQAGRLPDQQPLGHPLSAARAVSRPANIPTRTPRPTACPAWTKADREIGQADVVLWYTFGQTHIPRVEDWPVMPATSIGFMLRPDGFFNANPALDVAPPTP